MGLDPFQGIVRKIVLDEIKEQYDDQHNWGHTTPIERYRLKGKWLDARWEPYIEQVNDGLWQRATIKPVDPEQNLVLQIVAQPATDPERSAFLLQIGAKVTGEAQVVRWRMGIKGLNATIRFDARIEAVVHCDLAVHHEPALLMDDIVLDPRVSAVELRLRDFNLQQLGIIGRDVARELSDPIEPFLARELKEREPKITQKINAAIAKHRDKLRFSPTQFVLSQWSKVTGLGADPATPAGAR